MGLFKSIFPLFFGANSRHFCAKVQERALGSRGEWKTRKSQFRGRVSVTFHVFPGAVRGQFFQGPIPGPKGGPGTPFFSCFFVFFHFFCLFRGQFQIFFRGQFAIFDKKQGSNRRQNWENSEKIWLSGQFGAQIVFFTGKCHFLGPEGGSWGGSGGRIRRKVACRAPQKVNLCIPPGDTGSKVPRVGPGKRDEHTTIESPPTANSGL